MGKKNRRLTSDDLKKITENKHLKVHSVNGKINKENKSFLELINEKNESVKAVKKNNNSTEKIINSLSSCSVSIDSSNKENEEYISLFFDGARIMTLNEILSVIQIKKYELFKYKKEWQKLIHKVVSLIPLDQRPFFDSECKITLFRQGVKLIDLDGFPAAFKYTIDALRYSNIISEDNPNIIYETKTIQRKGKTYQCGIKIEKLKKIEESDVNIEELWFSGGKKTFNFQ